MFSQQTKPPSIFGMFHGYVSHNQMVIDFGFWPITILFKDADVRADAHSYLGFFEQKTTGNHRETTVLDGESQSKSTRYLI